MYLNTSKIATYVDVQNSIPVHCNNIHFPIRHVLDQVCSVHGHCPLKQPSGKRPGRLRSDSRSCKSNGKISSRHDKEAKQLYTQGIHYQLQLQHVSKGRSAFRQDRQARNSVPRNARKSPLRRSQLPELRCKP